MTGAMSEAQSGRAVMEDVSEDTFERFCQFGYTRDYTTPSFDLDPDATGSSNGSERGDLESLAIDPYTDSNEHLYGNQASAALKSYFGPGSRDHASELAQVFNSINFDVSAAKNSSAALCELHEN